jgi:hypothetical protein
MDGRTEMRKPRDVSQLVNCLTWTVAIVNKGIPLRPYDDHRDRTALRQEAFRILLKEQLRYQYQASPDYLMSLLPPDQDKD